VIRYFGNRKKIFNVHFRNIRGTGRFVETFPDEGDGFRQGHQVYREVGLTALMPDHAPASGQS
jgi:mannonate dehydratase